MSTSIRACPRATARVAAIGASAVRASAAPANSQHTRSALRAPRAIATLLIAFALAACTNPQSTLAPAGIEAERVARLFWVMFAGATFVWITVLGFALYATRADAERHGRNASRWLIIGGGVVFPTVVLGALLVYGLALMPPLRADASPGSVRVYVSGEQWWWRVRYRPAGGEWIELANEIRLPVGERTEFELVSPDVIHSFWIPSLGGKMDMIPGRVNRLVLEPTRTGVFRGVCAEYCGASHAHMEFVAVVMERDAFARWLRHQAAPARPAVTPLAQRGARAFLRQGCGGCHVVRGTPANGPLGPDLTHVGSRLSLAAGTLPNTPPAFARWISQTHAVKPEVLMPSYGMLSAEDIAALAAYMESLQ